LRQRAIALTLDVVLLQRDIDQAATRVAHATLFPTFAGEELGTGLPDADGDELAVSLPVMPGERLELRTARCRIAIEDALAEL
jgi:hypothetical protein